jgi:hypothetical protein
MHEQFDNSNSVIDLTGRSGALASPHSPHRAWVWVALLVFLGLGLYLLLESTQIASRVQSKFVGVESGDAQRIREYNQRLEVLQERMTSFIADSVDDRLRTLEKNVESGKVGATEIGAIQELKHEVKLLETYSAGKGGDFTDPSRMDHPRFQPTPGSRQAASLADMAGEISRLKTWLYLGLGSCGAGFLMIGSYWLRDRARMRRLLPKNLSEVPLLPSARREEDR